MSKKWFAVIPRPVMSVLTEEEVRKMEQKDSNIMLFPLPDLSVPSDRTPVPEVGARVRFANGMLPSDIVGVVDGYIRLLEDGWDYTRCMNTEFFSRAIPGTFAVGVWIDRYTDKAGTGDLILYVDPDQLVIL